MATLGALVIALMVAGIALGYQDIRIGVLLPVGDEAKERIVERVFRQRASMQVVTERLEGDSEFHYHKAACRLRRAGCCSAVLSPSCDPLPGQAALACPGAPGDPSLPSEGTVEVGTRPETTRATLDLLRDLGWREIVYLHDHPNGAEKLQVMFRVGYSALRLRVAGLQRVGSAREAAELLQEKKQLVVVDVSPPMAAELLSRMTHAGRTQHSFLLMQPTLPDFWRSPELRALDVIGFSLPQPPSVDLGPLTVEDLYFHDAALVLSAASAAAWRSPQLPPLPSSSPLPPECEGGPPDPRIANLLKKVVVSEGLTGSLQFSERGMKGSRTNVTLTVIRTSRHGPYTYGWWSAGSPGSKVGGIQRNNLHEGALPQIQDKRVLRIVTRLSDPFTMRRSGGNASEEELEGFCVDLASALCDALHMECHLYEAPDGRQGRYDPHRGTWDGMIGEILTGRADLAVGDLSATADRLRAADFLQPFLATSLSLLLRRPSTPSAHPFSWGVWGAALGAALLCALALHALARWAGGAPDSIEASSAIWERRLTPLMSGWLTVGSALMQPTGVYPRSLSSRVLACSWWAFTGFLGCMLVASMAAQLHNSSRAATPQLRQLQALSLEAVIAEALENGWPEIGVVSPSFAEDVIQESSVPLLVRLRGRMRRVASEQEGAALAQEPGFALLTHSAWAARAAALRPCRLAAVHGAAQEGALAVALAPALEPNIKTSVEAAFEGLHSSGFLGHLHRKWWIDNSQCKGEEQEEEEVAGGVSAVSLLIGAGAALLLLLLSFGVQLSRKIHTKESRRQQLTFEDINFDQRLPTPPPELLAPPPVLEVPEIEGGRSEESFKDFFDRMRTASS